LAGARKEGTLNACEILIGLFVGRETRCMASFYRFVN
jgi:hypothetical protein